MNSSGEIKMKVLISIIPILLIGCMEKSNNQAQLAALAALSQSTRSSNTNTVPNTTACTSNYNCTSSPSFSTLAAAGTNDSCATSGCHTRATQQSGLDITDYNSTKAFTNPGNPCSSRMYTAITTGAMAGNSNRQINEAVYCWIAGGSNQ